jgi:glycosyltransferase involved in cell wall biosynthesis
MSDKNHIVYLGCPGFPYGLAEVQKLILVSNSLILKNNLVTVVCNRALHKETDHPDLLPSGNFKGIEYVYTTGSPFRSDSFIKRNWYKVKGIINEILFLKNRKRAGKLDAAILSTNSFYSILYYSILSKLFRFRLILNYAEYYSPQEHKWYKISARLSDKFYDRYGPGLVTAIFPISEFLIRQTQKVAPGKKYLKIPVLVDVNRYDDSEIKNEPRYFLFCGAAAYMEIIKFIIDSFGRLNTPDAFLYLVINGDQAHLSAIQNYLKDAPSKEKIKVFSRLSEKELNSLYKNATALLIPLRPNLRDEARFPHKIGEYLASGNPVVSTNYGEVKHYFKDMENMLIAPAYDTTLYADKMRFVLDHPEEAQKIGRNGRSIALNYFDYRLYGEKITGFFDSLESKRKAPKYLLQDNLM